MISSVGSLTSPFYIFGYGSLLWRPGDLLGAFPSFPCTAYEWKRLFVQRSWDHRGTPEFPGFVATLVHDQDLRSTKIERFPSHSDFKVTTPESECIGLVWLVPNGEREKLLEELDYREKGGYERHSIKVRLHCDTPFHNANDVTDAIVYTGSVDNPLFDFSSLTRGSHNYNNQTFIRCFPNLRPRHIGANVISVSKGPSGTNIEYLFGLQRFIKTNCQNDDYLSGLCLDVLLKVGSWRAKRILNQFLAKQNIYQQVSLSGSRNDGIASSSESFENALRGVGSRKILGWGSNELGQLRSKLISSTTSPPPSLELSQLISCPIELFGERTSDANLAHISIADGQYCVRCWNGRCLLSSASETENNRDSMDHTNEIVINIVPSIASNCTTESRESSPLLIFNNDLPLDDQLFAGTRWSGRLTGSTLKLWGDDLRTLLDRSVLQSKLPSLDENKQIEIVIDGVAGCALGYDHMLLLSTAGQVIGLGNNMYGQCNGAITLPFQSSDKLGYDDNFAVVKLAVGLRHSCAITADGALYSWGQSTHQQSMQNIHPRSSDNRIDRVENSDPDPPFCAEEKAKEQLFLKHIPRKLHHGIGVWHSPSGHIIDVACGAKHTICIDDNGEMWSIGDNKYGCLGRSADTKCNQNRTHGKFTMDPSKSVLNDDGSSLYSFEKILLSEEFSNVKWQRVSSGWHHSVARGVRKDGATFVCGWGRCDLRQFPYKNNDLKQPTVIAENNFQALPLELLSLPNDAEISEIWCGSEFTLAADDAGLLWSAGWNEHGNLGNGTINSGVVEEAKKSSGAKWAEDVVFWQPVVWSDSSQSKSAVSFNSNVSSSFVGSSILAVSANRSNCGKYEQVRVATLFDSTVACGGSHCLAFTN